jgi:FAD/FMN-containing dehydrogenase
VGIPGRWNEQIAGMARVNNPTRERTMTTKDPIEETTIETFRDQIHGEVLQPGNEGYDAARTIWNAMIDREPAVIAQCSGTADVIAAVNFAQDLNLRLSVHGGGHNVAGTAVCDDGLMIDLSPMDSVHVDPEAKMARVDGGATWADVDHETQAFGLATTGGLVSDTGVGGLTLGGGTGYLDRKYGLAHDNLRSIDVVTADGELVRASDDEHQDLFWGMRGGGGNLGIATAFEFDLHEVGPELLSVRLLYPYEAAPAVLEFYGEFMADAPNEVESYALFVQGSPEHGHPEPLHGNTLLTVTGLYAGPISDGRAAFKPLREFGDPIADMTQPLGYAEHQQLGDDLYCEGHRNYWKSAYYTEMSEGFIDTVVEHVDPLPSSYTTVYTDWMQGAIAEADQDATAFPHRDKLFSFTISPKWSDPERDEELVAWAREFYEALEPYTADGVYVNYMDNDEGDRVEEAYGDRYERLVELKNKWDPDNLFDGNQNIEPTT